MKLPDTIRLPLARARRCVCEAVGIARYSRPANNGLDRKLERYLDIDGGFFIEAGANDGFTQSNSYYFERLRGWRGILVEPIPELYEKCRRLRKRATVVRAALVDSRHDGGDIEMDYAGLMSVTEDAFGDMEARSAHVRIAVERQWVDRSYKIRVPVITLNSLIETHASGCEIDLLCLDVEGAEMAALGGLDIDRHTPRFICVEARDTKSVAALLCKRYKVADILWDSGTHQDVLFRRI